MTDEPSNAGTGQADRTPPDSSHASGEDGSAQFSSPVDATRRDVVRAAGAGAGALALGTGASTASAQQGDGPGQTINTPQLGVEGNTIVDPDGNTVKLRGLNVADPKMLDRSAHVRGKTAVQTIDFLTDRSAGWYPRVIRLPVEPGNVIEMAPVPVADEEALEDGDYPVGEFDQDDLEAYCEEHLDDVVQRCAERNVYCIVDYHRHWGGGSFEWANEDRTGPRPGLPEELELFWDFMAERYGDRDHVLFEVYNEPTEPGIWGDPTSDASDGHWRDLWYLWKDVAQPWVDTIREHTDNLVLVGSPGWTTTPDGALEEPFDGENLVYTYHIYGGHVVSMEENWDELGVDAQGLAAGGTPVYEEFPVFVTEFGWERTPITDQHIQGTTEGFGSSFLEFIESHDSISWTAWCGDPIWRPIMFERPWVDEDPVYDPAHMDAVGDPYADDLEVLCEDPPCEWELLEEGDHGSTWMGDSIKSELAEKREHLVPGEIDLEAPSSPDDQWTNDVTATTIELEWESVDAATTYRVYVDGEEYDDTPSTSMQVSGLEPETTYTLGLRAENDAGTSETVEIDVTTAEGGDGCPEERTATVEGREVCDVNGDTYYRDMNADGEVTQSDVSDFFGVQHRDAYRERPAMFDFDGDGDVGLEDVLELFGET